MFKSTLTAPSFGRKTPGSPQSRRRGCAGALLLCLATSPAFAQTYPVVGCTVDLIADGGSADTTVVVGSVTAAFENGLWTVSIETTGVWAIAETHLHLVCGPEDFPQTRSGNPKMGRFDHGTEYEPPVQWADYVVEDPGCGDEPVFMAAHAVVVDPESREETAWAAGQGFPGHNWAIFFECDRRLLGAGFRFLSTNSETGLDEYVHEDTGIEFALLPGGDFQMGSPIDECDRKGGNQELLHTVTLTPFLIGKYEVTQAQYEAVVTGHPTLSATPSFFMGDNLPVEQVSFNDLNAPGGFLGRTGLSLPSEAQWEYACRAGTATRFAYGNTLDSVTDANFDGRDFVNTACSDASGNTSLGSTIDVGSRRPNSFGLFDVHGNVFEWCEDVLNRDFYAAPEAGGPNPLSLSGSTVRVLRGGGLFIAKNCRAALRAVGPESFRHPSVGFRVARSLP